MPHSLFCGKKYKSFNPGLNFAIHAGNIFIVEVKNGRVEEVVGKIIGSPALNGTGRRMPFRHEKEMLIEEPKFDIFCRPAPSYRLTYEVPTAIEKMLIRDEINAGMMFSRESD